ncbi:MAG: thiolase domain-containing protein [Dehalococcoidia bacterium]|nr:thiolase domain-containing protein [Dehalococcoidia bacterium]
MANQRREAAIVGIHEWPKRVDKDVSSLQIKAASIHRALDDAGLQWSDVDALYDANDGEGGGGLGLSAYLNIRPTVIDTTQVGGSSYEFQAAHAMRDIAAGKANVAVLSYGSKAATQRIPIGTGGRGGGGSWQTNMEVPYGSTLISNYAMVAHRHMHEYGTTSEQLAEISVATRHHAMRNPEAVQAMKDLQFQGVQEISVADVLDSRMIADPLHLLECCMVSDGGGALVITSADVARGTKKPPVWLIGSGEATKYRTNDGDITVSAGAQSAPIAFGQAEVTPAEIDIAMIYDSFTITVAVCLEDLGFCKKGEVGDYVSGGRLRFDAEGGPALNTDGGGLSSNHPGMRGLFLLLESVRQLRGESTSQVPDAKLAVAHGNGGLLGGSHTGGTVILAAE